MPDIKGQRVVEEDQPAKPDIIGATPYKKGSNVLGVILLAILLAAVISLLVWLGFRDVF